MYIKELKKMELRELKKTRTGLERLRNASQKLLDDTFKKVSARGGRTELKKMLRFAESSLNKTEEMISRKEREQRSKRPVPKLKRRKK
tara:strand:- start:363 stop:626 length:264 start_codon:yes stop_codon:yes gene_type:complete